MIDWENNINAQSLLGRTELKNAMAGFAAGLEATHFVTANFNRDITYAGAKQALKAWHARVERKLLGPKWLGKPVEARTEFLAVIEHMSSNPHWHLLVRPASGAGRLTFEDVAEPVWQALQPAGSLDVQRLATHRDVRRTANYCAKDLAKPENYEGFVLSREFISDKKA